MQFLSFRKILICFLIFNIQVSSNLQTIHLSNLITPVNADSAQDEFVTSTGEKQSTNLDLSGGSRAVNFGFTILTTLIMLVIGSVGITMIREYTILSNDSKVFTIGAIIYMVGELVLMAEALTNILMAKEDLTSKKTDLQIETLEAIKKQQKTKIAWLITRAGLQTAASVAFGTAVAYSLKLYLDQIKDIKKTEVAIKNAETEQQKNLALCKAQDPSVVLVEQNPPPKDPSVVGQPYYSKLCPQTITPLLSLVKYLKTNLEVMTKRVHTIFSKSSTEQVNGDTSNNVEA